MNMGVLAIIMLLLIVLLIAAALIYKKHIDYQSEQEKDKQLAFLDKMTTAPAEISIKYIEKEVLENISDYIKALYSLNPQFLPAQKMTQEFYMKTYKAMEREYNLSVRRQLISYTPLKRYRIEQNNESIYAVQELRVDCEYELEFIYYHPTQTYRQKKKVKQLVSFLSYNDGWYLANVGQETIKEKIDLPLNPVEDTQQ